MSDTAITSATIRTWMTTFADLLLLHTDRLTELDSAIGDADHGANMARGAAAIHATLADDSTGEPGRILQRLGEAMLDGIGGAAGPLYASLIFGMAEACGGNDSLAAGELASALDRGVAALANRGRAELHDKTMYDAALPAIQAFQQAAAAGGTPRVAAEMAAAAARHGLASTEPLQARKGRASYLGPRSVGHLDPGAASVTLLFEALEVATARSGA
jgi:dihydroxyacetone kinase-like protein